jgi:maltose/moltooligosaccharide transporter
MNSQQNKLSNLFYVILGLPATAMGFGLSIQIAVLSWILRTKYGLDIHEIGIVWAAGPIAGILGQPIVGLISDKVWFWGGRRRPFILVGGLLAALCILALPYLGLINDALGIGSIMAVAITVALTLDLAINISFNPTRAIIADVTPDGPERTKGYTWMQAISNFFGAGAYLISALIGNDQLIFIGAFIVVAFSVLPLFFIEEPREFSEMENPSTTTNPTSRTHWDQLVKIYFAHAFSWLGIQSMFIYSFAFLEQRFSGDDAEHLGRTIGWLFFILNAVGSIWPIFVLGPLSKRFGRVRTHIFAVSLMALGYFLIASHVQSIGMLYAVFALLSIGWAAVVSLPFAIMTEQVDRSRMGFFMGIFNLSVVLPQLASSFLVGIFIQRAVDKSLVYWICAVSLAISAALWFLVKEPESKKGASSTGVPGTH